MAEQGVGIERDLGIEHDQLVVTRDNQRVDFQHVHVLGIERRVQLAEELGALLGEVALQAQGLGERTRMCRPDTRCRVDGEGVDLFRSRMRDFFNIHAAFGRCDDRNLGADAIDEQR